METTANKIAKNKTKWGLIGAIVSAMVASLCCIGPLVLLALGVSGAWIGNLAALEPYRPIFIAVALGFLTFGFYKVYRKPKKEACTPGSYCANPRAERINKAVLWVVTVLILGFISFPYAVPYLIAGNSTDEAIQTKETILEIRNMTCSACTVTVTKSLTNLEGVKTAKVTLKPPQAVIRYNPAKVSPEDLIKATQNAGYPSAVKQGGR